MTPLQESLSKIDLTKAVFNLRTAQLYEIALNQGQAKLTSQGALAINTGKHTGRSANDKFIVKDQLTQDKVYWGDINKPFSPEAFSRLKDQVINYLNQQDQIFVQETIAGADPETCVSVQVITESAFHSLFVRNMLAAKNTNLARLSYGDQIINNYHPEYVVYHAPHFQADSSKEPELNSSTFILVNYSSKEIVIAGTAYAGEIKKGVFALLNFIYPQRNIMPMHCSANTNEQGEVSIFFGLSGTGKTTLSADPERILIGDDEHGWSDQGVFNFEYGCYAKSYGLTAKSEPEIYEASRRFGVTFENVVMNDEREIDYFDKSLTENGRISYPLSFIPNSKSDRLVRKQPTNIIMLTCDAFGVLPAVAKLSPEEASEQFLLGYTAKIAGTEMGIKEPTAVFSYCFGAPFMPLAPQVYGDLLRQRIAKAKVNCWLVNTGWAGGSFGVGKRMSLELTRLIIHKINSGELATEECREHKIFKFMVPQSIEMPENQWLDQKQYLETATHLLKLFDQHKNKIK